MKVCALGLVVLLLAGLTGCESPPTAQAAFMRVVADPPNLLVNDGDWNQWGGSSLRNNVAEGKNIPTHWKIGDFDEAGDWKPATSENIKWVARLGSQAYGSPVVANGKVFVGTNNAEGRIQRYPNNVDLGCLLCFDEATGAFLWQDSNEKLPTGRVNDWPQIGICSTPLVEGKRLWYLTNRAHVRCLDVEGFRDNSNEGPYRDEPNENLDEADIRWSVDMIKSWRVAPHNQCNCSPTSYGNALLICTSNGVDEGHIRLPNPQAPSFVALNKYTGKLLWSDNSPGANILHGQWSSPAAALIDGVPQAIFAGGDGWVYAFDVHGDQGHSKLLWKFDVNPKASKYVLGGRATRNHLLAQPVIYNKKVYIGVGEDPEHGEGDGHLYCIDATMRGDISAELAVRADDPNRKPLAPRRIQAIAQEQGEIAIPNPNSGAIWHFEKQQRAGVAHPVFEDKMHRTISSVAIQDGLLFVADFSGLMHCLDAKTGKQHWAYDLKACVWGSPLIVEDKVYIGDEDGVITIFKLSDKLTVVDRNEMVLPIYGTPCVANNVLYVVRENYLFAIAAEPPGPTPGMNVARN